MFSQLVRQFLLLIPSFQREHGWLRYCTCGNWKTLTSRKFLQLVVCDNDKTVKRLWGNIDREMRNVAFRFPFLFSGEGEELVKWKFHFCFYFRLKIVQDDISVASSLSGLRTWWKSSISNGCKTLYFTDWKFGTELSVVPRKTRRILHESQSCEQREFKKKKLDKQSSKKRVWKLRIYLASAIQSLPTCNKRTQS